MKTLSIAFGVLLLPWWAVSQVASVQEPSTTETASASTSAADVELFTQLTQKISTSIENQDMEALGKLMAPEFTHYNPAGGENHKKEELEAVATWGAVTMETVGPVNVNRYGNTAVTVEKGVIRGKDKDDKPFNHHFQQMVVWVLRDGQWLITVAQTKSINA